MSAVTVLPEMILREKASKYIQETYLVLTTAESLRRRHRRVYNPHGGVHVVHVVGILKVHLTPSVRDAKVGE